MSSLASITEDATYGVEGEDTPPIVPRRRKSPGIRSDVSSDEATNKHVDEALERSSSRSDNVRTRRGGRRRSHSKKNDNSSIEAENKDSPNQGIVEEIHRQYNSSGQHRSRHSKSPRSSSRRSLSSSEASSVSSTSEYSSNSDWKVGGSEHAPIKDESSNQDIVGEIQRHSYSSGQYRRRHSKSRSLSRRSMPSSQVDWTGFSRNLDRHGAEQEFRISSSENDAHEDSDEEKPGAYRVSIHSPTSRLLSIRSLSIRSPLSISSSLSSSNVPSFALVDEDVLTDSTHSQPTSSGSGSIDTTIVRADAARDLINDIAAAREQGRAETLTEAVTRDSAIVVAVPQPRRPKVRHGGRTRSKLKPLVASVFLGCLLVLISGIVGYFTMPPEEINGISLNTTTDQGTEGSELVAEVRFDPPTAEVCESVANGTDVAGHADMFVQYFDLHLELTSNSEEDAALLVRLLKQQIQLLIMPLLVGCDDLVGNVIGNGVVESASNYTAPCLFRGNPNCVEVVLTIKIYLRRNEDGSTALEIMNNILLGEELNDTLELLPSVETANVSLIVPSPNRPSIQFPETVSGTPSAIPDSSGPTMEPTIRQTSTTTTTTPTMKPTTSPTPGPSPTPVPVNVPVPTSTLLPAVVDTPSPSTNPTLAPTAQPTKLPTKRPTPAPTHMPTKLPSRIPSEAPSFIPTANPTPIPTADPTPVPTKLPTRIPTDTPSFIPSLFPSLVPSDTPSTIPSMPPSLSATVCTSETRIVPLYDEGEDSHKQVLINPSAFSPAIQRSSCRTGANSDLGIVRYTETGCTAECLFTIPFSAFETYCNENPAGGFTFSIPDAFVADTQLYVGNVAGDFDLTCGGQLSILNFDSDSLGCYADAPQRAMVGTRRLISDTLTVQQCLNRCLEAGFSYAGLVRGNKCFCDNEYMRYGKFQDSRCHKNCVADGLHCGGDWAISVYPTGIDGHQGEYTPVPSAAPVGELGCWQQDPEMIRMSLKAVSVVRCTEYCRSRGNTYAGLKRGRRCYCGDSYHAAGAAATCDKDCAGPCGGARSWSVYDTTA